MTEFEKWLNTHSDKFTTYSYHEIYELAVACGFDQQEVLRWLTVKGHSHDPLHG